jgi:hypothetical protein
MATRKHRSRRAKTFRHEHALIDYDEDGNEIEVTASELRAKKNKPAKAKPAAQTKGGARTRPLREPPVPSWNRAFRRGALWGGLMLVVVVIFFKSMPLGSRILVGLVYATAFVPLTYTIDRTVYRNYVRRRDKTATSGSTKSR